MRYDSIEMPPLREPAAQIVGSERRGPEPDEDWLVPSAGMRALGGGLIFAVSARNSSDGSIGWAEDSEDDEGHDCGGHPAS